MLLIHFLLQGIVSPKEMLALPLQIQPHCMGELVTGVVFDILGSSDPPLEVVVRCIGEGPVISVSPSQLDWGVCLVLTPVPKALLLRNESSICAEFETVFVSTERLNLP